MMPLSLLLLLCVIQLAPFCAFAVLVAQTGPNLTYHGGPLLSNKPTLDVYIVWYGHFSKPQKRIMQDFFSSIGQHKGSISGNNGGGSLAPNVSTWWSTMTFYKDDKGSSVSPAVKLAGQVSDRTYSLGKDLKGLDLDSLAKSAINKFNANDPFAVYVLLTSEDVLVDGFCESQCATHAVVTINKQEVPYIWVGNSATQCPGQCAWPFALPQYMDYSSIETAKKAPNEVGMDGMVINVATILAGAATNPHGNAYYEGNPEVPLEAATACAGIFGPGAYPGDPGFLLTDSTGASYNAVGVNMRRFLLPCLWHPVLRECKPLSS